MNQRNKKKMKNKLKFQVSGKSDLLGSVGKFNILLTGTF